MLLMIHKLLFVLSTLLGSEKVQHQFVEEGENAKKDQDGRRGQRGLKRKRDCDRENGEKQNTVLGKDESAVSTSGQRAALTATAYPGKVFFTVAWGSRGKSRSPLRSCELPQSRLQAQNNSELLPGSSVLCNVQGLSCAGRSGDLPYGEKHVARADSLTLEKMYQTEQKDIFKSCKNFILRALKNRTKNSLLFEDM